MEDASQTIARSHESKSKTNGKRNTRPTRPTRSHGCEDGKKEAPGRAMGSAKACLLAAAALLERGLEPVLLELVLGVDAERLRRDVVVRERAEAGPPLGEAARAAREAVLARRL